MSVMLLYSSRDGHTKRIMQLMAQKLAGHVICDTVDLQLLPAPDWSRYRAVMLGAAIRYGHFHPALWRFVTAHQDMLNQRVSAFFCVSLVARNPEKCTPAGNPYLRKFLACSPWKPTLTAAFAGALCYPRYRWFDRHLIRLIMTLTQGETDTRKEVTYTNWQQVAVFAKQFSQLL